MLDGLRHVSQAATTAWISFFTSTFSGSHPLRDYFLDFSLARLPNVVAYMPLVIAEAVAQRHRVFRFLYPNPDRKHILGDDVVTQR